MYEAIVVLPLLGAIIAGAIALFGAASRLPGANPPPPDDDHAAPLVPEDHIHGAPDPHAAHAEIHRRATRTESRRGKRRVAVSGADYHDAARDLLGAFLCRVRRCRTERSRCPGADFQLHHVGRFQVDWALHIDTLTAIMLVVVTTVSGLVHLYSIGYMADDPYRPRFFSYLSFFTFAMLMLVTADNLAQLFFGWEGVGLASYLLIGFWFHKPEANAAAMKAFIVNRVGDFGFALGIFAVFLLTGSINFDTIFAQAPDLSAKASII